jgi:hypothetical protein
MVDQTDSMNVKVIDICEATYYEARKAAILKAIELCKQK